MGTPLSEQRRGALNGPENSYGRFSDIWRRRALRLRRSQQRSTHCSDRFLHHALVFGHRVHTRPAEQLCAPAPASSSTVLCNEVWAWSPQRDRRETLRMSPGVLLQLASQLPIAAVENVASMC